MMTLVDIRKMYPELTDAVIAAYIMPAVMDTIGFDAHIPSYLAGYFKAQKFYQEQMAASND